MGICKKCGEKLVEGAKFCTKCGAPSEINIPNYPINEQPSGQRKFKKNKLLWGGFVLTIIFSISGYYYFSSPSDNIGGNPSVEKAKKQAKKKVETNFFSYMNGSHFGIMDSNLNIINENIGMIPVVFNQQGVGVTYQNEESVLINTKGDIVAEGNYRSINYFNVNHANAFNSPRMQSKNGIMDFNIEKRNDDDDEIETLSGLIDSKGNIVLEPSKYMFMPFNGETLTTFYKDGEMGVVNEKGDILVEPVNSQVVIMTDDLMAIKKNSETAKFEIIDLKGNVVEETSYDTLYALYNLPGHFSVTNSLGKTGIIDSKLKEVTPLISSSYISVSDNGKYITIQENEKYGLRKINGDSMIEARYDYLSMPNEKGILAFQKGDTNGLMTLDEEIIDDNFDEMLFNAAGTNLFLSTSYDDDNVTTSIIDSSGELIAEEGMFVPGNISHPDNIYALLQAKEDYEDTEELSRYTIFNKHGTILSDQASFMRDLGENLFIQEDKHLIILNKDTGKIIKEKEL